MTLYWEYYIMGIILIPGLILSVYAQVKVNNSFNKFNERFAECGRTANEIVRTFLDTAGLNDINIVKVSGHLTDHYNHRKKIIALSESVYSSSSIAAIGVACHELGHALQYKSHYFPIKLRNFIIPICNFANSTLWFLIVLGAIFYYLPIGMTFLWIGVGVFGLSVLLNLITLPIEYNASNRALKMLETGEILLPDEVDGASVVLRAAGLTYVAGLVVSILNLLRLLFIILRRRRD